MPLLHRLTVKVRARLSLCSSVVASVKTSPVTFEVRDNSRLLPYHVETGGIANTTYEGEPKNYWEEKGVKMHKRMDSFLDEKDGVSMPAQVVLGDKMIAMEGKKIKRSSKFREEFGDGE